MIDELVIRINHEYHAAMSDRPYPARPLPVSEVAESVASAYGASPWPEADLIAFIRSLLEAESASRRNAGALIEAMLPREPVPSPVAVLQARRNAAARDQLLREFGGLSSGEVAERAGSRARNRAAIANRWKQERRIFSVPHLGAEIFPGFQFDEQGQPREGIREVVIALSGWSPWELALWFIAANGWLDGRRPVDLLETEPKAVVGAARHAAAGIIF